MTEEKIRALIKKELNSYLSEKEILKLINQEVEKQIKEFSKDAITKSDVKDMIRKTIVNQYKYLWEKSKFFIGQI